MPMDLLRPTCAELDNYIKNPPETPLRMRLTPELAEFALQLNSCNRPPSHATIQKYSRQLKDKKFAETFQQIVFARTLELIDGQQRLQALIMSGCSHNFWVAFGEKKKNFAYYDIGKKRTNSDVFSVYGVSNYVHAAAITRHLTYYDYGTYTGNTGGRQLVGVTPEEMYTLYLDYARKHGEDFIQEGAHVAGRFSKKGMPFPSPSGFAYCACRRKNRAQADTFFKKVATGEQLSSREHAYKLRERIHRHDLSRNGYVGDIFTAWNAMRDNRQRITNWHSLADTTKLPSVR